MNQFKPLVSILIPLYNSEKYIAETIESCLNQSYKNIEIIIVDDGSIDNSFSIAQKYESEIVKLYKQENKGACAARNKAFELSKGEYIQYLDSDDLMSPNKIENQLKLFEDFGIEIISSCNWAKFYNDISEAKFQKQPTFKNYESGLDWIIDSIEKKDMAIPAVWLISRYLNIKAGKWNESLTINQDGEFFMRVLLKASAVKFCKHAYVYYRSGDPTRISYTTNKRAKSIFMSYLSYEENILNVEDSERTRFAIYKIYLRFIYENYEQAPDLAAEAKHRIKALGFKKLEPYGGETFKKIAKIIGFENALRLRKLLKKT